jgi:hypothetical protein
MFRMPLVLLALLLAPLGFAASADLSVSIEAPASVRAGETLRWRATVANLGPDIATSVVVNASDSYSVCQHQTQLLLLLPGESKHFDCASETRPSTPNYVRNLSIQAQSTTPDPDSGNNYAGWSVEVVTPPDVAVWGHPLSLAAPALSVPIAVWMQNLSRTDASGVTVTITTPTRVTKAPDFCTIDGSRAVCTAGELKHPVVPAGGSTRDFVIEVEAPDASATLFEIGLEIAAVEGDDPFPANNRSTVQAATYDTHFVTSTADDGPGSLRAALAWANAFCDATRHCLVAFRIPAGASAWHTIRPLSPLPVIVAGNVVIDGTTQTGYFGDTNPAGPEVEVSGDRVQEGDAFDASGCSFTVRGLAINGFPRFGVMARGAEPCEPLPVRLVEKNYIGTDPTGTVAKPNERGVWVMAPSWVVDGNVISGNRRAGIFVDRGQTIIRYNKIGLNATVTAGLGNGASGIYVGPEAAGTDIANNYIGFNGDFGVALPLDARSVSCGSNSFQANAQAAIDWGLDGAVTNTEVPIPVITDVWSENGYTYIRGTSTASGTFEPLIDLYANDAPDPSGYGEGQYYLGQIRSESDNGTFVFTFVTPVDLRGKWVTATATKQIYGGWATIGLDGDTGWGYLTTTSEFSRVFEVK